MNNLEKAISLINTLRIFEFFDLMDKEIGVNSTLNQLRMEFISGHAKWDFYDKLKILAKNTLKNTNNSTINFNDIQILPKHQETMSESFKEYYIKSIQELKHLPTSVEKNDLLSPNEYYEATFNLYSKYVDIYSKYNNYTTQHLGEDLGFALYKRTDFVQTEVIYKAQTTMLLEEIAKLRAFLLELNNPSNADGLHKAIVELKDLKEEKQYLLLFKQFIQALKAEDLSCYDLVGNLDIKVLLNEIKDFDIRKSVERFWSYVVLEHSKATGLGKKKVFVENLLKTQEIVQNLNYLITNLIK